MNHSQRQERDRVTHLPVMATDLLRTCRSSNKMTHKMTRNGSRHTCGAAAGKVPVWERHAGPPHPAAVPTGTPGLPGPQSKERDVLMLGGQFCRARPECDLPATPPTALRPPPPARTQVRERTETRDHSGTIWRGKILLYLTHVTEVT